MPYELAPAAKQGVVLLVDDDIGDQELARRALRHASLELELQTVDDGEEALDYLQRRGEYVDPTCSPRPSLILLDLNMPRKNGREVLAELRHDPSLCRIPVVVLTTSRQEADIDKSYGLGCNSYIQKPVDLDEFTSAIDHIGKYWFGVVTLPPEHAGIPA